MTSDVQATISIPTVSRLGFFREALESAASQSFQDYEIQVSVNSPEPGYFRHVAAVVNDVEREHPARAIRMLQPPSFLHIADHTNFMVDQAAGDYWCYLADDDRMEPSFLETLVSLLDAHKDAGFAFCDFRVIDESGRMRSDLGARFTRTTHRDRHEEGFVPHAALARLALWNAIWLPCSLLKRSTMEKFPFDSGNEAADRDFWLRIADAPDGLGAVYTRTPLLNYRLHEDQYSSTPSSQSDWIRSLERCHSVAEAEPKLHNQEVAHTHAMLGKALLDMGDRAGAWHALRVALRKNSFDRRTYRFLLQALLPAFLLRFARRTRGASERRRMESGTHYGRLSR